MSKFTETAMRRAEMVREWRFWVRKIAEAVKELLSDVEVYVVGSVVRGDYVACSDVDVLIVSPNVPERAIGRAGVKVLLEEKLNLPYYHPFEIHLLKPEEADVYLRRAGRDVLKIM